MNWAGEEVKEQHYIYAIAKCGTRHRCLAGLRLGICLLSISVICEWH